MLFCDDHREKTMRENPEFKEWTRVLGEMWREASTKKRRQYKEKAKQTEKGI